ncbi:MAG: DUF4268 domain-containing protein [Sphingobacteriales bacterium]|nr:MAG: DUF4268 domain-containing protein [Sphingobacteriales bacterium]
MYSREEAARLRENFWTTFGKYMAPVLSEAGEKINWINYKTGVPHVRFRMDADTRSAEISLSFTHPDAGIRALYFDQMKELKTMFHSIAGTDWHWTEGADGGRSSKVYSRLESVSVFRQEDWPLIISFLKPRLISLDAFWSQAKYPFEALG